MKYHPIFGDYHLNRDYLGPHWNRKFIKAIQVILNATKGKIGKGKSFFYKAFGKDEEEFTKLLYRRQIKKAPGHWNVRYINCPNLIRMIYRETSQ